jgi:hypothetical protein
MRGWAQLGVMRCLIVIIAALLTAGCVGVPVRDEVPLVTIAEIHEDPWAWDGRRVRIVGETSYCYRLGCSICDLTEPGKTERTDWQCLGIGSDVRMATEGPEQSFSSERRNFLMRYARLEIEATYLARCSGVPENPIPEDPASDYIWVCTDRANELDAGEVTAVLRYRAASTRAINSDYEVAAALSADNAWELLEALSTRLSPENRTMFLESYSRELIGVWAMVDAEVTERSGAICFCDTDGCEDQWPRSLYEATDAPGNPYPCYFADRLEDGAWFFPLQ